MATKAKSTPNTHNVLLITALKSKLCRYILVLFNLRVQTHHEHDVGVSNVPLTFCRSKVSWFGSSGILCRKMCPTRHADSCCSWTDRKSHLGKARYERKEQDISLFFFFFFFFGRAFRVRVIAEIKGLRSTEMIAEFINCLLICVCDCVFVSV